MYKMNILLKFIFVILTISIVVITNNRIVLWLMLLLLTYYNLYKNKKLSLLIDLILVILLGFSKDSYTFLIIFKILFIINFIITIYNSLSIDEKKVLVRENTSTRLGFYEDNFNKLVNDLNEKKINYYDSDTSIDSRIEEYLGRKYLQSRIRFYNSTTQNNYYKWTLQDTIFLIVILVIFMVLFILR